MIRDTHVIFITQNFSVNCRDTMLPMMFSSLIHWVMRAQQYQFAMIILVSQVWYIKVSPRMHVSLISLHMLITHNCKNLGPILLIIIPSSNHNFTHTVNTKYIPLLYWVFSNYPVPHYYKIQNPMKGNYI